MSEAQGLLAVWVDIPAALEADFNDWYDREHLAERAGIPGFRTARRYIAEAAEPKYFSLYETDSLRVFASLEYRRYYLGPAMSAWSKRIMPAFENNHRRCCRFVAGAGGGIGAMVASLRFRAEDALEAKLTSALKAALTPSGAIGAKLWRTDLAVTFPDGPPRETFPELVVTIEAISAGAARAGADALLGAVRDAGAPGYRGLYRLLHALPA